MSGVARWGPAAAVALGAAAATAHGLVEVAAASKVPGLLALTYPLITDGLALVAYSATRRLNGRAAAYSWVVVVAAAGLSGLAQAFYLAADTVIAAPALRFGVGAWPAVAAGLAAHLLHLLVTAEQEQSAGPARSTPETRPGHDAATEPAETAQLVATAAAPPSVTSEPVDPRVVALARRLERGEDLTGPAVAAELGLGERSGRRLLADARTYLEQDRTARPAGLHLVTHQEQA